MGETARSTAQSKTDDPSPTKRRRGPGRNNKRPRADKVDRRKQKETKYLTAADCEIAKAITAEHRLNAQINLHPVFLHTYPCASLSDWFRAFRSRLAKWFADRGLVFLGWWVRESYEGDRREHIHLTVRLHPKLWPDLKTFIHKCFLGDERLVTITQASMRADPQTGEVINSGTFYRLKQCLPNACYRAPGSIRPTHRYEQRSRHDGAPIAPVMGKKIGWTKNLDSLAQGVLAERASRREQRRMRDVKVAMAQARRDQQDHSEAA